MKEVTALAEAGQRRIQSHLPGWSVTTQPLWGNPAKTLLKTIEVWKPDLVVIGSNGRSTAERLLLGSVSTEIVHHAPCSVRVVRTLSRNKGPIRVLVGTDGSNQAKAAVEAVARRSWPDKTEARVVAVVETLVPVVPALMPALEGQTYATEPAYRIIEASDERQEARLHTATDEAANRLQQAGLATTLLVTNGAPGRDIVAEAEHWNADCIFVGARGLGALDRLVLGSVSDAIVHHGQCAVEVVRS
jgi:nucleotide-binding universal stress UspA family protein